MVLLNKDKQIRKIITNAYVDKMSSNLDVKTNSKVKIVDRAIIEVILNYSYINTVSDLFIKNKSVQIRKAFISDLLSLLSEYLKNLINDSEIIIKNPDYFENKNHLQDYLNCLYDDLDQSFSMSH